MTRNPNPRTTARGATRAAQGKEKVDANAARVAVINEAREPAKIAQTSGKLTTATKTIKRDDKLTDEQRKAAVMSAATNSLAKATASTSSDQAKISKLVALLAAAENAVTVKTIEAATAKRDRLMLDMIAAGAGYTLIAKTRGVPTSTNRGLIRVLQGGKRI